MGLFALTDCWWSQVSSDHTWFWDNHCVMPNTSSQVYECGAGPGPFSNESYRIHTHDNHYYFPDQPALPTGALCAFTSNLPLLVIHGSV